MRNADIDKYVDAISKLRVYCKCGHSLIIPMFLEKRLCHWCGNYVFRDKRKEFIYKFKKFNKNRR